MGSDLKIQDINEFFEAFLIGMKIKASIRHTFGTYEQTVFDARAYALTSTLVNPN